MQKTMILSLLLLGTAALGGCADDEPVAEYVYEENADDDLYVYDDEDGVYYPYHSYTKSIKGKKLYKYSGGIYIGYTGTPNYNPGYKVSGQKSYYGTSTPAVTSSSGSQFGKSSSSSSSSSYGKSGSSFSGSS